MKKIYEDKKKAAEFETAVETTATRANQLIRIWDEFMPFIKCDNLEMFEKICAAPGLTFDRVLIDNVAMSAAGDLRPSPDQVAKLFNIDRINFYNLCEGRTVKLETCAPCQRAKVKPGKTAISLGEFRKYAQFLTFTERNEFIVNRAALDEYKKRFEIYATSPRQLAIYNHFEDLVQLLNLHCAEYPINNSDKERIAVALNLQLSKGITGDFITNSEYVKNLITAMQ